MPFAVISFGAYSAVNRDSWKKKIRPTYVVDCYSDIITSNAAIGSVRAARNLQKFLYLKRDKYIHIKVLIGEKTKMLSTKSASNVKQTYCF